MMTDLDRARLGWPLELLRLGSRVALVALVACGGGKDEATDSDPCKGDDPPESCDPPDQETAPTGDTEPQLNDVGLVGFGATFGFDNATGETVDVNFDGNDFPAVFEVTIATEAWNQDPASPDVCYVQFPTGGETEADWMTDFTDMWWGFDVETGSGAHNCDLFDLTLFENGDPVAQFGSDTYGWGIAIGGELASDVEDIMLDEWGLEEEDLDDYYGGLIKTEVLDEDQQVLNFVQGFEVDPESFEIQVDDNDELIVIDIFDAPSEETMVTAWYNLNHMYYYGFGR